VKQAVVNAISSGDSNPIVSAATSFVGTFLNKLRTPLGIPDTPLSISAAGGRDQYVSAVAGNIKSAATALSSAGVDWAVSKLNVLANQKDDYAMLSSASNGATTNMLAVTDRARVFLDSMLPTVPKMDQSTIESLATVGTDLGDGQIEPLNLEVLENQLDTAQKFITSIALHGEIAPTNQVTLVRSRPAYDDNPGKVQKTVIAGAAGLGVAAVTSSRTQTFTAAVAQPLTGGYTATATSGNWTYLGEDFYKPTYYDWTTVQKIGATFTAGSGTLDAFGESYIVAYVNGVEAARQKLYFKAQAGYETTLTLNIPVVEATLSYVDLVIRTTSQPTTITTVLTSELSDLKGALNTSVVPVSALCFMTESGKVALQDDDRWISVMGQATYCDDDNLDVTYIWKEYIDSIPGCVMFKQMMKTLKCVSDMMITDPTMGVHRKYVALGVTDFHQLCEPENWIRKDGPFGGMSSSKIDKIMVELVADITDVLPSLMTQGQLASIILGCNKAITGL
jgi:hypothetical protein